MIEKNLLLLQNSERAKQSRRFFKTGKGEYAQGDIFLGITMPQLRTIAKSHIDVSLSEIQKLLNSQYHEFRMAGLLILMYKCKKECKKEYVDFYLQNTKNVNNWDLVDCSAHYILGAYVLDKKKYILYELIHSDSLWERRIAIVANWYLIRNGQLDDIFKLSKIALHDTEDLMHKAIGWMLREAGKKDEKRLLHFLDKNYKHMPRTMLRYSLEKLSSDLKSHYMA